MLAVIRSRTGTGPEGSHQPPARRGLRAGVATLLVLLALGLLLGCPGGEEAAAPPPPEEAAIETPATEQPAAPAVEEPAAPEPQPDEPADPLGWHDERMPEGMRRADEEDVYVWDTGDDLELAMVYVPPGDFRMGSDEYDEDDEFPVGERPEHDHPMPQGYYIGRYPVTVAEFRAFVEATGHVTHAERQGAALGFRDGQWERVQGLSWRDPGFPQADDHPVVCVSWRDAKAFCDWAGLALPTEAQWEKAARGTDGRRYAWGDAFPTDGTRVANIADDTLLEVYDGWITLRGYDDGYAFTSPVGAFPAGASPYGAYDMTGNVWEWTNDYFESSAYRRYAAGDTDPPAEGFVKAMRGGGWFSTSYNARVTYRLNGPPLNRGTGVGFRAVKPGVE